MKIHSSLVRQLREQRAWSQEHLAEVAGLSLRTVQRVEADGGASAETRMALAAAFGIDVAALSAPVAAPAEAAAMGASAPMPSVAAAPAEASPAGVAPVAPANGQQPLTFEQYRALRLAVVLALLVAVDVFRHDAITWSRWPLLVGAVLLALRLFRSKWVQPRVRTR